MRLADRRSCHGAAGLALLWWSVLACSGPAAPQTDGAADALPLDAATAVDTPRPSVDRARVDASPPDTAPEPCAPRTQRCDLVCVNTLWETAHCGGCDTVCAAGPHSVARCESGRCALTCDEGFADCDGDTANGCEAALDGDRANCGACGSACPGELVCDAGRCGCPMDRARCGDRCVSLSTSDSDCGACGHACAPPDRCQSGACLSVCARWTSRCGATHADCDVDLRGDPANCGACGARCPAGQRCTWGVCTACASPMVSCGYDSRCIFDLGANPLHCGACGAECPGRAHMIAACVDGGCRYACTLPYAHCGAAGDECDSDLSTSASNCGACGHACADGESCADGVCLAPSGVRPLSPLSTSILTSHRPIFRWRALRGDVTGARLEVCATRDCASPLRAVDVTGLTHRLAEPLDPGVYFWRVRARVGDRVEAAASPSWEFVLDARDTRYPAVDGWMLDMNGDGLRDTVRVGTTLDLYEGTPGGMPSTPTIRLPAGSSDVEILWGSLPYLRDVGYELRGWSDLNGDGVGDLLLFRTEIHSWGIMRWGTCPIVTLYGSAHGLIGASYHNSPLHTYEAARAQCYPSQGSVYGEVDGDGMADVANILVSGIGSELHLNLASGGPDGRVLLDYTASSVWGVEKYFDFNSDGLLDILYPDWIRSPTLDDCTGVPVRVSAWEGAPVDLCLRDCDGVPDFDPLDGPSAVRGCSAEDADHDGAKDIACHVLHPAVFWGGTEGLSAHRCGPHP